MILVDARDQLRGEADEPFAFAVRTNFILFFFNLLPIPPLDGGDVAEDLTRTAIARPGQHLEVRLVRR